MTSHRKVAYRQLAEDLRRALRSGQFSDREAMPTESQIAESRGVSRSTVRRAMQDLVAEGLIYRVAGRGTFPVSPADRYLRSFGSIEDLLSLSVDTLCEITSPLQARVDIEAAGRLRLETDQVVSLTLRRSYGASTFCVTQVHLPPHIGTAIADFEELSVARMRSSLTVIGAIDERFPGLLADAEQTISAVPAGKAPGEALDVVVGSPLLRVDRLYSDAAGNPIELAISYFDPAKYTYRMRMRRQGS